MTLPRIWQQDKPADIKCLWFLSKSSKNVTNKQKPLLYMRAFDELRLLHAKVLFYILYFPYLIQSVIEFGDE